MTLQVTNLLCHVDFTLLYMYCRKNTYDCLSLQEYVFFPACSSVLLTKLVRFDTNCFHACQVDIEDGSRRQQMGIKSTSTCLTWRASRLPGLRVVLISRHLLNRSPGATLQ